MQGLAVFRYLPAFNERASSHAETGQANGFRLERRAIS
jgi:hypothetical protein